MEGMKVLVVHPELGFRIHLEGVLRSMGHTPMVVESTGIDVYRLTLEFLTQDKPFEAVILGPPKEQRVLPIFLSVFSAASWFPVVLAMDSVPSPMTKSERVTFSTLLIPTYPEKMAESLQEALILWLGSNRTKGESGDD